ncbi:MFS transporter [Bacillus sp. SPARC3]|uniref:MFS transporter n=1 Tax=Bacillus sp. SPARC3 TaxID=2841275 RepID=UPI001C935130|nr:MFS transporter [Bacillus sp. SPARC3]MBY4602882.1 MFS transporter [Bacillus sp. SPARC3]
MSKEYIHLKKKIKNSAWMNKNFIILFLSTVLITFGSKVYELVIPLLVYNLTHSSIVMGLTSAIEYVPNMLLAVFIGALIDRVTNKKKFMIITVICQAILLILFYLVVQHSKSPLVFIYFYVFLIMTFNYSYLNVRFGIVKITLPETLYTKATANFAFITQFFTVLGPAIAAGIILFSDLNNSLLITSLLLIVAAILSVFLDSDTSRNINTQQRKDSLLKSVKEAWTEFRKLRELWLLTWFVVVTNSSYGMFNVMLVYFSKETLSLTDARVGILLTSLGVGGVLGSLLTESFKNYFGIGKVMGCCIFLTGLLFFSLSLVNSYIFVYIVLTFIGFFSTLFSVNVHVYRQYVTPIQYFSSIVGITGSLFKIAMPIFIFGSGWITEILNVRAVFILAALLNIILFKFYIFTPLWKLK